MLQRWLTVVAALGPLWVACIEQSAEERPGDESRTAEESTPFGRDEAGERLESAAVALPRGELPPAQGPLYVTGDVVPPRRIGGESVDVSDPTCQRRWPPMIVLEAVVDEDGTVGAVTFLKQAPPQCVQELVRRALGTWRYEPARLGGEAVAVRFIVTMNIHLQ